MIVYCLAFSLLFLSAYLIGYPITARAAGHLLDRPEDRVVVSVWVGVVVFANVLLLVSLVCPLRIDVGALVLVVLMLAGLAWSSRSDLRADLRRASTPPTLIAFVILQVAVSLYVVRPIILWEDTGIYHAGAIRWLNEYGSVRGLALIQSRFGSSSSWFALSAPLNAATWGTRFGTFTGGFALLMLALSTSLAMARILRGISREVDWYSAMAFVIVAPFLFRTSLAISSSPDVPVIVLTVLLFSLLVIASMRPERIARESSPIDVGLLVVLLAAGIASFKLSGLAVAAAALGYALVSRRGSYVRRGVVYIGVFVVLLVPTLAANFMYSGCLLFPDDASCVAVPWVTSGVGVRYSATVFAKTSGGISLSPDQPWFMDWCRRNAVFLFLLTASSLGTFFALARGVAWRRYIAGVGLAIAALFVIGLVTRKVSGFWQPLGVALVPIVAVGGACLLGIIARTVEGPPFNRHTAGIAVLALVGLGFVFWQAPSIRFGLGVGAVLPAFMSAFFLASFARRLRLEGRLGTTRFGERSRTVAVAVGFLLLFSVGRAAVSTTEASLKNAARQGRLDLPESRLAPILAPYEMLRYTGSRESVRTSALQRVENRSRTFPYYYTELADCWNAPLPCANYDISWVELYDPRAGFAGGFTQR